MNSIEILVFKLIEILGTIYATTLLFNILFFAHFFCEVRPFYSVDVSSAVIYKLQAVFMLSDSNKTYVCEFL